MNNKQFIEQLGISLYSIVDDRAEREFDTQYGLYEDDYVKVIRCFLKQTYLWNEISLYDLNKINFHLDDFSPNREELIEKFVDNFDINAISMSNLDEFMTDTKENFYDFLDEYTEINIIDCEFNPFENFFIESNWDDFTPSQLREILNIMKLSPCTTRKQTIIQILDQYIQIENSAQIITDFKGKFNFEYVINVIRNLFKN